MLGVRRFRDQHWHGPNDKLSVHLHHGDQMNVEDLAVKYTTASEEELTRIVSEDYALGEAVVVSHPEMSQDAGFELFDRAWAQRYWKTIAKDISGAPAAEVESWALNATIVTAANAIVVSFGLPAVALSGAVALAVLILRAARAAEHEDPGDAATPPASVQ